jgi:Arc/MetJ-type ribon-helix-helix transcriptional regulator
MLSYFPEGVMQMTLTKPKIKKKTSLKRTTIFLTEEHREELRRLAYERRTSMANLIREAVLEMLEDEEDIRAIQSAEKEGEQYIPWEEVKRKWNENHKEG